MREYRANRASLLGAGVNFVEVDLVREGDWRALLHPEWCEPGLTTPYRVAVWLPEDPMAVKLLPITLRQPLPSIAIPLRRGDPEMRLELQPLIDVAYANGRYGLTTHYDRPCEPPLEGDDLRWAEDLIAKASR